MALWKDDTELFTIARQELFSSVVGDAMDKLGLQRQYLPPGIQPLSPDMSLIGRAMPVLEADIFGEPEKPFGLMFEALDDLKQDEIYLCVGGSPRYAVWDRLQIVRPQMASAPTRVQLPARGRLDRSNSRRLQTTTTSARIDRAR